MQITVSKNTRVYQKGRGSFLISTGAQLCKDSRIEIIQWDYLLYKNVPCKAVAYKTGESCRWILCEESGIPFPN
ncbi:MAG: hypothetical protein UU98_C0004G0050 [Parcubacteria group bacterium GW2011_GWD2_42_14]|nr:MAG: hypothetical protein UU98_C0004G0050 [Parcubacteria group bacterium GW2011_GWD2_42_14]